MSFEATPFPRLGNVIAPAENPGFPAFIGSRGFRLRGRQRQIRGVPGDEAPWEIAKAIGRLDSEGHLTILVRGLVFKDDPLVQPPELIGTNDEPEFRGLVSCLSGDSFIHAKVELPDPCVAPIIMVVAGSEEKWFAVTGFEAEEEE